MYWMFLLQSRAELFNVWTKNTPSLMLEFHSLHDRKCAKFWPKIPEIFSLAATRALSDLVWILYRISTNELPGTLDFFKEDFNTAGGAVIEIMAQISQSSPPQCWTTTSLNTVWGLLHHHPVEYCSRRDIQLADWQRINANGGAPNDLFSWKKKNSNIMI
jgi:hypothetical protein